MFFHTVDTVMPYHCLSYVVGQQAYGTGLCALDDDVPARMLLADHLSEFGEAVMETFQPGEKVLIKTVTLYFVGEVVKEDGFLVVLKDASWVHWTGQLSVLLRQKRFTGFENQESRARTEFVGDVKVSKAAMVAVYSEDWELPMQSLA